MERTKTSSMANKAGLDDAKTIAERKRKEK
jgi:hypothetical protein